MDRSWVSVRRSPDFSPGLNLTGPSGLSADRVHDFQFVCHENAAPQSPVSPTPILRQGFVAQADTPKRRDDSSLVAASLRSVVNPSSPCSPTTDRVLRAHAGSLRESCLSVLRGPGRRRPIWQPGTSFSRVAQADGKT